MHFNTLFNLSFAIFVSFASAGRKTTVVNNTIGGNGVIAGNNVNSNQGVR